jgi:hypothetical protein
VVASQWNVTARWPGAKDVPDMTPEEHQRCGDATQVLFRKVTTAAAKELP